MARLLSIALICGILTAIVWYGVAVPLAHNVAALIAPSSRL